MKMKRMTNQLTSTPIRIPNSRASGIELERGMCQWWQVVGSALEGRGDAPQAVC
jgi:hypothetical protein